MSKAKLKNIFTIKQGNSSSYDDYFDIAEDNSDTVAYVSAATNRNGINGFVIPKAGDIIFNPQTITVASQGQGSVGYATVQPHKYIASTLVLSLEPNSAEFERHELNTDLETLTAICAFIRKFRWRFSFGRNIDEERIGELSIDVCKVKRIVEAINQ
jgi:hypothetical protein